MNSCHQEFIILEARDRINKYKSVCILPVVVTCPPLTAPGNGDIGCSLGDDGDANPGDTCTFTCDDGYELGGSTSRTCGDDGSWSGNDTTCTIGMYMHFFVVYSK